MQRNAMSRYLGTTDAGAIQCDALRSARRTSAVRQHQSYATSMRLVCVRQAYVHDGFYIDELLTDTVTAQLVTYNGTHTTQTTWIERIAPSCASAPPTMW